MNAIQSREVRSFFMLDARLTVKRPGRKPYSGTICAFTPHSNDPVVIIQRPRSLKMVRIFMPGDYIVGRRMLRVVAR